MSKGARVRLERAERQGTLTVPRQAGPACVPREALRAAEPDGDLWLLYEASPAERERLSAHLEHELEQAEPAELLADLRHDVAEVRVLTLEIDDGVARCRRRGASWADIGQALGISRQAAWERYR